ncbi:unnamed protein product [Boreogadus saida]
MFPAFPKKGPMLPVGSCSLDYFNFLTKGDKVPATKAGGDASRRNVDLIVQKIDDMNQVWNERLERNAVSRWLCSLWLPRTTQPSLPPAVGSDNFYKVEGAKDALICGNSSDAGGPYTQTHPHRCPYTQNQPHRGPYTPLHHTTTYRLNVILLYLLSRLH